ALHRISHRGNRSVGGIQKQPAYCTSFIIVRNPSVGWSIAASLTDGHAHIQLTTVVQVGDHVLRIDDLDIMTNHDIACSDGTSPFFTQGNYCFVLPVENQSHTLEVQQDLDNVFLYTLNSAVFVDHTIDFNFFDSTAWHG